MTGRLWRIDVSDPDKPSLDGHLDLPEGGIVYDLVQEGALGYMAAGNLGVLVVDLYGHESLRAIGSVPVDGAYALAASAGRVYVAASTGWYVLDVTNESDPVIEYSDRALRAVDVVFDSGTVYVSGRKMGSQGAGWEFGIWAYAVSRGVLPTAVGHVEMPCSGRLMANAELVLHAGGDYGCDAGVQVASWQQRTGATGTPTSHVTSTATPTSSSSPPPDRLHLPVVGSE